MIYGNDKRTRHLQVNKMFQNKLSKIFEEIILITKFFKELFANYQRNMKRKWKSD